jgi:hypothetical protein
MGLAVYKDIILQNDFNQVFWVVLIFLKYFGLI